MAFFRFVGLASLALLLGSLSSGCSVRGPHASARVGVTAEGKLIPLDTANNNRLILPLHPTTNATGDTATKNPDITWIWPKSGPPEGGNSVSITGWFEGDWVPPGTDCANTNRCEGFVTIGYWTQGWLDYSYNNVIRSPDIQFPDKEHITFKMPPLTPELKAHQPNWPGFFVCVNQRAVVNGQEVWGICQIDGYYYVGPAETAKIDSVTPREGEPTGGTQVTIKGSGFITMADNDFLVKFGDQKAASWHVVDQNTIIAVTPPHASANVDVSVWNHYWSEGKLSQGFTYKFPVPLPTLVKTDPDNGPIEGGTRVDFSGNNWTSGTEVYFGGVAATQVQWQFINFGILTAWTPPHSAGKVDITFKTADGGVKTYPAAFTYTNGTPPADQADLSVSGFSNTAQVSPGGSVNFSFTAHNAGTSAAANVSLTITLPSGFTLSSASGAGWTCTGTATVTCTQATLAVGDSAPVLLVTQAPNVENQNFTVQATVASSTADPNSTNNAGSATVLVKSATLPAPTLTSLTPVQGPQAGGTRVELHGSNLRAGATVSFGGTPATSPDYSSVTSGILSVFAPAHAPGAVNVTVTNTDGQSATLNSAYTYRAPDPSPQPPVLTSLTPVTGSASGGTRVELRGTNFNPNSTVSFGGVAGTSVDGSQTSSGILRANAPAHAAGVVNVTVTNPDGQSSTLNGAYTFVADPDPAPVLTDVSPSTGPKAGGTQVEIHGSHLKVGATLTLGGITVQNPDTSAAPSGVVKAITPAHGPGAVDIVLTNPDGQSVRLSNGFTYQDEPQPKHADLGISLTASSSEVETGSTIDYTVSVSNAGPDSAEQISAALNLSGGMTPVSGTGSGWTCSLSAARVTCTRPLLAQGMTSSFVVRLRAPNAPAMISLSSECSTQTVDPNASNNQASTATQVKVPIAIVVDPEITEVNPGGGTTDGGTKVNIKGAHFDANAQVFFGGTSASAVVHESDELLVAVSPKHVEGKVTLKVVNPDDGGTGLAEDAYEYVKPAKKKTSFLRRLFTPPKPPTWKQIKKGWKKVEQLIKPPKLPKIFNIKH